MTNTIKTADFNTAYNEKGTGNPPLLFIHGFPFNHTMWEGQLTAVGAKRRTIAYDIRGYGNSQATNPVKSVDQLATDLISLLDALKIEKAIVCGFSMGGYILMNAATRFPERFAGIILADTQCIADSEENRENRFKSIAKVEKEGVASFTEGMIPKLFAQSTLTEKPELVQQVRNIMNSARAETVTATLKALAERKETCTGLKSVTIPTLIICGKDDGITPLSQAELINNAIKNSELKIIQNAGHLANLENPEAFNEAVLGFLARLKDLD